MTSHYLANASTNTTYHTSFSAMSKRIEPGPPASLFGPPLLSNTKAEAFSSASRKRRPESNPAMFTNQIPDERQGMASSSTQSPTAKKSRTNTPWTAAEEQRLRQMRDAGNSWADIAKTFPSRTEGSVKKHWYKDMHYAEFAEDESVALLNAIKEYEANKWKAIGAKVGKPAKACEQYAKEHFNKT